MSSPSVELDLTSSDGMAPQTSAAPDDGGPDDRAARRRIAASDAHHTLVAEVAWLLGRLEAQAAGDPLPETPRPARARRLDQVATAFGLSAFECDTLLLAAAVELDGGVAGVVAGMTGTPDPRPTFGLALASLDDGHWDALAPAGPLRRWGLVTLGADGTVATRRLRIDEDILHHLVGLPLGLGELHGVADELRHEDLAPSQRRIADRLAATVATDEGPAVVHLTGTDRVAQRGVALRLADRLDGGTGAPTPGIGPPAGDRRTGSHRTLLIDAAALPPPGPELTVVATLVDRRAWLLGTVPVIALGEGAGDGDRGTTPARWFAAHLTAPVVVVLGAGIGGIDGRMQIVVDVHHPPAAERRRLWRDALGDGSDGVADRVTAVADELAHHHRLGAADIRGVVRRWQADPSSAAADVDTEEPGRRLRDLTRDSTRGAMDHLAQRLETSVSWDDLVLPGGHTEVLHDLVRQVRHRATVHDDWGFEAKANAGLGIAALFTGDPGTGKTLAARVVANELGLDLYRIDLSATVDKYIGETEKNLSRIFDAAEAGGFVLLFDEADALFGKRGEVRHGQDRYANLEVAHLLQRMEAYRGLAILTTNLRGNVDRAFLRRLRFVLQFPYPGAVERARIWRHAFPAATPRDGIDPDRLAKVAMTGGSIAAIALSAAFAAADEGTVVMPRHVLKAARIDAAKHDRVLTDGELAALS